mmetsp:Transcript_71120/g.126612  ORF Transcript_71120/g.126612 Transcript_71120/m.126612 type:complete len:81 (+) Transcript_71120:241-483(+)
MPPPQPSSVAQLLVPSAVAVRCVALDVAIGFQFLAPEHLVTVLTSAAAVEVIRRACASLHAWRLRSALEQMMHGNPYALD